MSDSLAFRLFASGVHDACMGGDCEPAYAAGVFKQGVDDGAAGKVEQILALADEEQAKAEGR